MYSSSTWPICAYCLTTSSFVDLLYSQSDILSKWPNHRVLQTLLCLNGTLLHTWSHLLVCGWLPEDSVTSFSCFFELLSSLPCRPCVVPFSQTEVEAVSWRGSIFQARCAVFQCLWMQQTGINAAPGCFLPPQQPQRCSRLHSCDWEIKKRNF